MSKIEKQREKRYLEVVIRLSKNAISKHGNFIDDYFNNQVKRLQKELDKLK